MIVWEKEVSKVTLRGATRYGTVTLKQSVDYFPFRYLPQLRRGAGGERGKSEMAVLQLG